MDFHYVPIFIDNCSCIWFSMDCVWMDIFLWPSSVSFEILRFASLMKFFLVSVWENKQFRVNWAWTVNSWNDLGHRIFWLCGYSQLGIMLKWVSWGTQQNLRSVDEFFSGSRALTTLTIEHYLEIVTIQNSSCLICLECIVYETVGYVVERSLKLKTRDQLFDLEKQASYLSTLSLLFSCVR